MSTTQKALLCLGYVCSLFPMQERFRQKGNFLNLDIHYNKSLIKQPNC